MDKNDHLRPDKDLAAICGLFCLACDNYIDTLENRDKLAKKAEKKGTTLEDCLCLGCRSDTLNYFCRERCFMRTCAAEKNVDFCVECAEYPCPELRRFQAAAPHRIELWKNQERIRDAGFEQWHADMLERYSCPRCGAVNSAYDLKCRQCGGEPSCGYVGEHGEALEQHLLRLRG